MTITAATSSMGSIASDYSIRSKPSRRCSFFSVLKKVCLIGSLIIGSLNSGLVRADNGSAVTAMAAMSTPNKSENGTIIFTEVVPDGWTKVYYTYQAVMIVSYTGPTDPTVLSIYNYDNIPSCTNLLSYSDRATLSRRLLGTLTRKPFTGSPIYQYFPLDDIGTLGGGRVITIEKDAQDRNFLCGFATLF